MVVMDKTAFINGFMWTVLRYGRLNLNLVCANATAVLSRIAPPAYRAAEFCIYVIIVVFINNNSYRSRALETSTMINKSLKIRDPFLTRRQTRSRVRSSGWITSTSTAEVKAPPRNCISLRFISIAIDGWKLMTSI